MTKDRFLYHFIIFLASFNLLSAQDNKINRLEYINRYKLIAVSEMERTRIPASIKMAQAIVESAAGTSMLSQRANNHFGIKCGSNWTGQTFFVKDDDYDINGNLLESCFRVYPDVEASFIAHSDFLSNPNAIYRYGFLFKLDPTDYRGWAYGLKQAGYATHPNYPEMLIKVIEDFELYKLDGIAANEVGMPIANAGTITTINDSKVYFAVIGDTPAKIAEVTGTPLKHILAYNEKLSSGTQVLAEKTPIYIQKKRRFFRGKQDYHRMGANETMYDVAQRYGIRLERLYIKNRLPYGSEVATGEKIKIGMWNAKRGEEPKLRRNNPPTGPSINPDGGILLEVDTTESVSTDELIIPNIPDPTTIASNNNSTPTNNNTTTPTNNGTTPRPTNQNQTPTAPKNNNGGTTPTTTNTENTKGDTGQYHTVAKGDTLFSLARKYGTTIQRIQELNKLTSTSLSLGQTIRVK